MKKSNVIVLAVVVSVIVVVAVGALVFLGMIGAFFSANGQPELTEASVAVNLGGGYDSETGVYNIDGAAQNMGQKDAVNCRVEVTFFDVDSNDVIKTELINIGNVPAESTKDINTAVQIADGSTRVSFHMGDPIWD